ncbi:MAG: hypothetical protein R3A44_39025 [Caldilineaceae bacterium]
MTRLDIGPNQLHVEGFWDLGAIMTELDFYSWRYKRWPRLNEGTSKRGGFDQPAQPLWRRFLPFMAR